MSYRRVRYRQSQTFPAHLRRLSSPAYPIGTIHSTGKANCPRPHSDQSLLATLFLGSLAVSTIWMAPINTGQMSVPFGIGPAVSTSLIVRATTPSEEEIASANASQHRHERAACSRSQQDRKSVV